MKNKTENNTNKNMLNKAMHKTRCKCMRKEEEKINQSIEITPMFWQRNSNRLLSRGLVNKLAF